MDSSSGAFLITSRACSGQLEAHNVQTWQYSKLEAWAVLFIFQILGPLGQASLHSPQPVHFSISTASFKMESTSKIFFKYNQ